MSISVSGSQIQFNDASTQTTSPFTGGLGFRNRIINGAFMIDQRNAGASFTPTTSTSYVLDRWLVAVSQNSKLTCQQNQGSVTPPVGFSNYFGFNSSSAYSVTSTDYFVVQQSIEGLNVSDLAWGTANAKTVTLSAWVYSSLTGTFGGVVTNSAQNRSYPFTYTISSANTWTQISVTIAGDTSGTWLTTNGIGITIRFGMGVGSTYSTTAGSWAAGLYLSATGATSVVGTNGATFYITGVQLEKGSTATSFDYRPYTTELQLCQRYYWRITSPSAAYNQFGIGVASGALVDRTYIPTPVTMRAVPTLAINALAIYDGSSIVAVSSIQSNYGTASVIGYGLNLASSVTAGKAVSIIANNSASSWLDASAEL
jgi:hypothetical protein